MSIGQEKPGSKISENQGHDAISTVQVKVKIMISIGRTILKTSCKNTEIFQWNLRTIMDMPQIGNRCQLTQISEGRIWPVQETNVWTEGGSSENDIIDIMIISLDTIVIAAHSVP